MNVAFAGTEELEVGVTCVCVVVRAGPGPAYNLVAAHWKKSHSYLFHMFAESEILVVGINVRELSKEWKL